MISPDCPVSWHSLIFCFRGDNLTCLTPAPDPHVDHHWATSGQATIFHVSDISSLWACGKHLTSEYGASACEKLAKVKMEDALWKCRGDTAKVMNCDQRETGDEGGGHTNSLFASTPNYSETEFLHTAHLEKTAEPSKATCRATCHVYPINMQDQSWLPVPPCLPYPASLSLPDVCLPNKALALSSLPQAVFSR